MIKVYAVQLSYDVSDEEKQMAEQALLCLDHAMKLLRKATDHLDIMSVPFKDNPDVKTEEVVKYRAALRRYRDKVIENFNNFKAGAFKCIRALDPFSSDTQTSKLVRTFISTIDSIEDQVNSMSELFDNLESKTFVADLNTALDEIHKLCKELEEIMDDRIRGHIKSNIIGKTWIDGMGDQTQTTVERKIPAIIDLMKQRDNQLKQVRE